MTDNRFVTFRVGQPALTVTALLPIAATLVSGYGGWQQTARPRRKPLTEWVGGNALMIDVPIVIGVTPGAKGAIVDGFAQGLSAVRDRTTLERMALPVVKGGQPPVLTVHGPVPHASDGPWVINDFTWDTSPLYVNGQVARQAVTVHLMQYVRDDKLADLTAAQSAILAANIASSTAAKKAGGVSPKNKVYVVKAGDTLPKVAASQLGSWARWGEIAALNGGIVDPNGVHAGEQLRMP